MIQVRKLLLTILFTSLGTSLYGMEKELSLLEFPLELRKYIAALLLEKTVGYNYDLFRKIELGNWVKSVAFSPDGKTILTGSNDNTARLWDVETGGQLKEFKHLRYDDGSVKFTNSINSVAFSPNGKTILTGTDDLTVRLWDVESGKQLQEFKGHSLQVYSVAFSPDGKTILTGSRDQTARLWDVESGEQLKVFKGHTHQITSVAFSPDGRAILTGSWDKTAIVWDVKTGTQIQKFIGHTEHVLSVAFSPHGKTILTGSYDPTQLWNVETGKRLKNFPNKYSNCSVAFSPDSKTILTGSNDKTARLWDVESGEQLKEFNNHKGGTVYSVAFSKDGEVIATASEDKSVMIYRRSEESLEGIKVQFEKRKQTVEKLYQEKIKFIINPICNKNEDAPLAINPHQTITTSSSSTATPISINEDDDLEIDASKQCQRQCVVQ